MKHLPTSRFPQFFGFCLMALTAASHAATVLLEEDFPAGQRLTQNLPQTAAWYSSSTASSVTYSAGDLSLTNAGASRFLLSYFTDSGAVNLAVGETLSAEFVFSLDTPLNSQGGIRVGIMNSGGNRISADGQGTANALYEDYVGYATLFNGAPASSADAGISIRERSAALNTTLITANTAYTIVGTAGSTWDDVLTSGTNYTGTYEITRLDATTTEITFSVSGADIDGFTLTRQDASGIFSFDTFVIAGMANSVTSLALHEVNISVIPEPQVAAMVLLSVGAFAILRRNRAGCLS